MTHDQNAVAIVVTVLETLRSATADGGLTAHDIAQRIGRDRSSVHRQLARMTEAGLVRRDDEGRYQLGWRIFALAADTAGHLLTDQAGRILRRLASITAERAHLSVLDVHSVLTVHSEGSGRAIESAGWVGRACPVHCTSSGRALLIDHDAQTIARIVERSLAMHPTSPRTDPGRVMREVATARRRGFSMVDGEFDPDLVAAAAPVRDFTGRIVAAINISAPGYRSRERLPVLGHQVVTAATRLTQILGHRPTGQHSA